MSAIKGFSYLVLALLAIAVCCAVGALLITTVFVLKFFLLGAVIIMFLLCALHSWYTGRSRRRL